MTFSLLARDPKTGALGGASATGNLCVGGWVLRGKAGVGISASQGHYPSTVWGEHALAEMAAGVGPDTAVQKSVTPDPGRPSRQLLALNQRGESAAFSGDANVPAVSELVRPELCAGGNMLTDAGVVQAMVDGYEAFQGNLLRKLLAGLEAGALNGGDARGLMSAAILIVSENHPPIDIRVDLSDDPLKALSELVNSIEKDEYQQWMSSLPTNAVPHPNHRS
ncbi:MAG: DUF1028 domain-containing protein [Paracoccaceae bacterium]